MYIRIRVDKRKSFGEDEPKDEINFDQSRVWKLITQLVLTTTQETAAEDSVAVMNVYLEAASKLAAKCVQNWPNVAVHVFDNTMLSKMISVLLR